MTKHIMLALTIICLMSLAGCQQGADKKNAFELQERCGIAAKQWANAKSGEIIEYRAHYNGQLNKCFVLGTLSPVASNNFYTSFDILYDVNENKELGHHTIRFSKTEAWEVHNAFIKGQFYGEKNADQAEQKWKAYVKEMMEE